MILVDYECSVCGGRSEQFVRSPAPRTASCPACRGRAVRRFAPVGLLGSARPLEPRAPATGSRPLCQDNPDVPGLCHMTPEAGRAWVARARRDNRSLDRELERQETARREHPHAVPEPASHDHGGAGHTHTHTSALPENSHTHPAPRT